MATIVSETNSVFRRAHSQPSGYASGNSITVDFSLVGGNMQLHSAIAIKMDNNSLPGQASCGIVSLVMTDGSTRSFGSDPAAWPVVFGGGIRRITLGLFCLRTDFTAWFQRQVWA